MIWVVDAKHIDGFKVYIKFNNGKEATIDMENYIETMQSKPIFQPLTNKIFFATLKYNNDLDTIVWDNGADIAPERLYELAF
jgi:hypothetical protein